MKSERLSRWKLYVITDADISGKSHQDAAKAAIAGGADVIQFREKNGSSAELYEIAGDLREITRKADVDLIVNDRLDRYPGEAEQIAEDGADYLGLGPVYEARSTKPDTVAPQGLDLIREVRGKSAVPIIAIGGIGQDNLSYVFEAGADGVAIISAIMGEEDITKSTRKIKEAIENLQTGSKPV